MVSMTTSARIRTGAILALGAGLALRLYLVLRFPMNAAADSATYVELARNWLERGVYGVPINGVLTAVDIRAPGYPAFLAVMMAAFHGSHVAILLAQVVVDLATCCVIALLASRLAIVTRLHRGRLAALLLSRLVLRPDRRVHGTSRRKGRSFGAPSHPFLSDG